MSRIKYVKYGKTVQVNDSVKEEMHLTAEIEKGEDVENEIKRLKRLVDEHVPRTR